ncbi:hypothetical protein LRH25_09150 [Ideonella azotifigens]|uniref:Uncharacterized protein n=1 Tax=Ideonella azotifigens TaxID=513160 RepID=A0ABN1KFP2_9BURK|nr:hypothetical protein [Ideonella azotifigens]MCD2340509.1 hypothetical protein [Ideonella azotifigens]
MASAARRAQAEAVLAIELGPRARFFLHQPAPGSPMGLVLDLVERRLGAGSFDLYWLDLGSPELFSLPGLSPCPVVYSRRHLSLSACVRRVFSEPSLQQVADECAEQLALKLMAEFALRRGHVDFAVHAFLKSIVGKGIWLDDGDQTLVLEQERKGEAYMAVWFYGLLHELGHVEAARRQQSGQRLLFSDTRALGFIDVALAQAVHYPAGLKNEIRQLALAERGSSMVGLDQLQCEASADMFAAELLLAATQAVMQQDRGDSPDTGRYLQELVLLTQVVALMDRCRGTATVACHAGADLRTMASAQLLLPPVANAARAAMVASFLKLLLARWAWGDGFSEAQLATAGVLVDAAYAQFAPRVDRVEAGLSNAMRFALRLVPWPSLAEQLQALRSELAMPLCLDETQRFCDLADQLGAEGEPLAALRTMVANAARTHH